ncbi:zinc-dependent alcohol dehydrogenase family protein [bacterium]|nr:zinc-dependent alcohol dehydrogenase family protein [bacterium]
MKAMVLERVTDLTRDESPLTFREMPAPEPERKEVRLRVTACGVCHTELDEIEGRTPPERFPMILGHEVVGVIDKLGPGASMRKPGERVGVGWFYSSCGVCDRCRAGEENLCPEFRATGRDAFGGYAEYMTVPETSVFPLPDGYSDVEAAPLLCAGAIGYRSLRLTGLRPKQRIGLTGFGASGHLVMKLLKGRYPESDVYVFARSVKEREYARELGAAWTGDTADTSPEKLHAIIDTTPVWKPVVEALNNLEPGGRLVINAIRKESADQDYLLGLDYPRHLWMEKEIKSVANVAPRDIREFLDIAAGLDLRPDTETYSLEDANRALLELKRGGNRGAKVLTMR